MKIYTKTGDRGETSLLSGLRVSKADKRLKAYGTVDELNSILGICLAFKDCPEKISAQLSLVQHRLFVVGSHLACDDKDVAKRLPAFSSKWITDLETEIDNMESQLTPLKQFIIPGGCHSAAHLHLARTVCRRAERSCAKLDSNEFSAIGQTKIYLNRLSDYLFVAARFANHINKADEVFWRKDT